MPEKQWGRIINDLVKERSEICEDNISKNGTMLLMHSSAATLCSAILGTLLITSYSFTEEECESTPVKLKNWFLGLSILQFVICALHLIVKLCLVSFLAQKAKLAAKLKRNARVDSQGPQQQVPSAEEQSQGQPAPSPETAAVQPGVTPAEAEEASFYDWAIVMVSPVLLVVTLVKVLWCLLGFISMIGVGKDADCNFGFVSFWAFCAVILIQTLAFNFASMVSIHWDRRSPVETGSNAV